MVKTRWVCLWSIILIGAFGCTQKNMVVLVPGKHGAVKPIAVSNQAGSVELNSPYQSTTIKNGNTSPEQPATMDQAEIHTVFGQALAFQPTPPVHFILYFEKVSTKLTPESLRVLPEIVETVRSRNSMDVGVIGHADTIGNKQFNLRLSSQRAAAVGKLLVERGVKPECLEISSHGEENPLILTEDNINEPKNRRVEVVVR